jgi:hypothetical protein
MTNRRPITRTLRRIVTPTAVEIFRRMVALEEQDDINGEYWDLAAELERELNLRPWEWPPYEPKLYDALLAASDEHAP